MTPESDIAQPNAEIARRKGDLLAAVEARARAERALKALMLDSADDPLWDVDAARGRRAGADVGCQSMLQDGAARRAAQRTAGAGRCRPRVESCRTSRSTRRTIA